jgi:hypothetical protein
MLSANRLSFRRVDWEPNGAHDLQACACSSVRIVSASGCACADALLPPVPYQSQIE